MALSTIDLNIQNNEIKGYIEIVCAPKQEKSSAIQFLLLFRRVHGKNEEYTKIYEKELNNTGDLSFILMDITTRSGYSYDYYIELTNDNETGYIVYEFGSIEDVQCEFDGLFIGNSEVRYLAPLDCKTSTNRITQVSYVTTLSGRTPYRVSNANTNYTTGQSSALFMPFDVNGNPTKVLTKEYVNEIVDFLSDGTNKILKTSDGDAWCVSIDPEIQITFDEHFVGSSKIAFNWTEIDEIPDIIEDNRKEKRLIGKTIISNGTYYASKDLVDGYNEVVVGVPIIANVTVSGHKLVVTHSGIFDSSAIEEDNTPEISNSAEKLISKTITSNGTYNPVFDNADGYKDVTVNVVGYSKSVQNHKLIYTAAS